MIIRDSGRRAAATPNTTQMIHAARRAALFVAAALPLKVYPPLFNRYAGGDTFGVTGGLDTVGLRVSTACTACDRGRNAASCDGAAARTAHDPAMAQKLADGWVVPRQWYPHLKWSGSAVGQMAISPDGSMLAFNRKSPSYWRKGYKGNAADSIWVQDLKTKQISRLTNSDPNLVAFFLNFLRQCYNVSDDKIAISINCFTDSGRSVEEIEQYWLERLGLPRDCLRKTIVNQYSKYSTKKRKGKLQFGVCALSVCSTELVQDIYGAIQEYAGFSSEAWLG